MNKNFKLMIFFLMFMITILVVSLAPLVAWVVEDRGYHTMAVLAYFIMQYPLFTTIYIVLNDDMVKKMNTIVLKKIAGGLLVIYLLLILNHGIEILLYS